MLLLRATTRQSLHDFTTARADLEQLIARRTADGQAHLTLAVVATVTGDYAAARRECDADGNGEITWREAVAAGPRIEA